MYCTNCGNKLKPEQNYCTNCGTATKDRVYAQPNNFNSSNATFHQKENNNGTVSLVLGILTLLFFSQPLISIALAIISIIIGKKYQKETGNKTAGPLLATIGLILSILIIIVIVLYMIFVVEAVTENIGTESFNIMEGIEDYYSEDFETPEDVTTEIFDLKGYSWTGDDNSVLYLNNDKSYVWYQDDNKQDDNYYIGNYDFYVGNDAINYIATNLKEYGLTKEEQQQISQNSGYNLSAYYLIVLNCTTTKINGVESVPATPQVYYYGFYDQTRNYLSLINIATQNQAGFTLKNKLTNIDI